LRNIDCDHVNRRVIQAEAAREGSAAQDAERRFCPTARISCALPIFERPSMSSRAASRRSSVTVIAPAPLPVPLEAPRLCLAGHGFRVTRKAGNESG
jgi:hypothetical protein